MGFIKLTSKLQLQAYVFSKDSIIGYQQQYGGKRYILYLSGGQTIEIYNWCEHDNDEWENWVQFEQDLKSSIQKEFKPHAGIKEAINFNPIE